MTANVNQTIDCKTCIELDERLLLIGKTLEEFQSVGAAIKYIEQFYYELGQYDKEMQLKDEIEI